VTQTPGSDQTPLRRPVRDLQPGSLGASRRRALAATGGYGWTALWVEQWVVSKLHKDGPVSGCCR
jgi:hypothetical protein